MQRLNDKYGRGSAAVNGAGFVDLEPGDTFSGLEAKLRLVQTVIYENRILGLRASIASRRNANEALEINKDTDSERTPRGGTAPFQNQVSQLASRIAYYVGDVNRTKPTFTARPEAFSVEAAVELIMGMADSLGSKYDGKELSGLLTIVIPVKNEEKNLPACLENVEDFKHVVLVDSGSTDRTREIFEGFRFQVEG